jgi:sporulation protein YlmC with PRC-barrel domain
VTSAVGLGDFHFGAAVFTADGVHVGSLRRLIVDEESLDLHAIVIKETRRFSGHAIAGAGLLEDDVAVPMSAVASVSRERVDLSMAASDVRRGDPYLTYQYAPLTKRDIGRMVVAYVGQAAFIPNLIEHANKRIDELEIDPGENIMLGKTGRKLGVVKDVVVDAGELVGVVMHPQGFFKQDVLLQVRFLGRSDDLALFAHLNESDLEHLEPFQPA